MKLDAERAPGGEKGRQKPLLQRDDLGEARAGSDPRDLNKWTFAAQAKRSKPLIAETAPDVAARPKIRTAPKGA